MDTVHLGFVNNFAVSVIIKRATQSTVCGHLFVSYDDNDDEQTSVVNFGSVAQSRDGESRSLAIARKDFDAILGHPFWNLVEEPFITYIENDSLDSIFYFPPFASETRKSRFRKWFFSARYDFQIAMAHFYFLLEAPTPRVRVSPISFKWIEKDEDMLINITHAVASKYSDAIFRTVVTKVVPINLACAKIIPLTVNELHHINDVRYRAWRECYVQRVCNEVRQRKVSFTFPYYLPWAMIYDIDEDMFMNPFMIAKFQYSETAHSAQQVLKQLHESEMQAPHDAFTSTAIDIFREDMHEQSQYASKNVLLSGTAIVNVSTAASFPFRWRSSFNFDSMRDMLFNWLYNFLVLHTYAGVMHTDAHINNLQERAYAELPAFRIDDSIYKPRSQQRGYLIDFSRTIMNPFFPAIRTVTNASPEMLAWEQGSYLERFFLSIRPNVSESVHKEIKDLIRDDFDRAFHILSILDPIFALNAIKSELLQHADVGGEIQTFIDKLLIRCNNFLDSALENPKGTDMATYPLRNIIKEHFEMVPASKETKTTLTFNQVIQYPETVLNDRSLELLQIVVSKKLNDI